MTSLSLSLLLLLCLASVALPKTYTAVLHNRSLASRATGNNCVYNIRTDFFEPRGCLTFAKMPSKTKLPECSVCSSAHSCATHFCFKYRCIYRSHRSKLKCFGPKKLPECAECLVSSQCSTRLCAKVKPHFKRCVYNTRHSIAKCSAWKY